MIKQLQEYYGDFYAVNPDVYHLHVTGQQYERQLEGVVSILLAHKKRPVVRYHCTSDWARRLAYGLSVSGAVVCRIEVISNA